MQNGSLDLINLEKKQGELLLLAERFEAAIGDRTGESHSFKVKKRQQDPLTTAREKLMKEATECSELLGTGSQILSRNPKLASTIYNRYSSAVDQVFNALAAEFPGQSCVVPAISGCDTG